MKTPITRFLFAAALVVAAPAALQAQLVWDTSTDAGYQNANGTWGTDDFWTVHTGGGSGTTLTGWTSGQTAWFGGNATVAATPTGNFTVTVDGTQTVGNLRQIQNGDGNYTLSGGTLALDDAGVRVDRGTMTVNSIIADSAGSTIKHLNVQSGTLILGGNNTFSSTPQIRGVGFAGTIRLNHAGALGTGSTVQFVNGAVTLDLNGFDISGKNITINNGQTGFLDNTAATKSVWSGNVDMSVGTGVLRAGGTGAELEISGIVSGNGLQSMDNGVLRLTGNNTHSGNSLRGGSTVIVGNANALGDASFTTFIGSSTLDLNGFDIGSRTIRFQQNDSRMVNENTSTAAIHSGTIEMQDNRSNSQVGGDGNLTLSGDITVTNTGIGGGLTKVGNGTLTLGGTSSYTGATTVSAGTLIIDGSTHASSAISVASGATLGGSGTINGLVTVAGTLAAGNSPGTLNFTDNLTLESTATLDLEVTGIGAGQFDILNGDGANTLNLDGILAIDNTGYSATFGDSITVFTNWNSIVGSFSSITGTDLGGGLSWDTSDLYSAGTLTVVPEPSTYALLGGVLALVSVMLRRRIR